jgi:hypothetical protein
LENLPPPRIKGKEERENIKGKRTDRRGKRWNKGKKSELVEWISFLGGGSDQNFRVLRGIRWKLGRYYPDLAKRQECRWICMYIFSK